LSLDEQKLRAIWAWAKTRKRVAVELCERATGVADPEGAELKAWAERLRALRKANVSGPLKLLAQRTLEPTIKSEVRDVLS
jgi:hypothetical protein